ncbi:MAG TPA: class I SAM-dependent methyltransferase [Pseudolabrys sp.]|nr:class I SAM-dependent methyltransferase [Pseudolabrys sp.]
MTTPTAELNFSAHSWLAVTALKPFSRRNDRRDAMSYYASSASLGVPEVLQTSSKKEINQIMTNAIRAHAKRLGRRLSIAEAGCGQRWTLDLSDIEYTLTGIDLDPVALELRQTRVGDLDVAIVGDLCSLRLPEASFDIVFSSFVLEHVPRADIALENLIRWLKPGGLLILRLPDRNTARGFLTRVLPYKVHVLFYRYLLGSKTAGQPGHAPYPTYYHPVITRERLCRFLGQQGLRCLAIYGDGFRRDGKGMTQQLLHATLKVTSILSLGRLTAKYANLLYIAAKDGQNALHAENAK